jgi:hypothetical protein
MYLFKIQNERKVIIQKLKYSDKVLFIFLIALSSCVAPETGKRVTTIYSGVKIDDTGYVYSEESILEINGGYYFLRKEAIYDQNGDLQKVISYKPEGSLDYTRQDLLGDLALINLWVFPLHQDYRCENGELLLDKEHGKAEKIEDDFFRLENKNCTVIYRFSDNFCQKGKKG